MNLEVSRACKIFYSGVSGVIQDVVAQHSVVCSHYSYVVGPEVNTLRSLESITATIVFNCEGFSFHFAVIDGNEY